MKNISKSSIFSITILLVISFFAGTLTGGYWVGFMNTDWIPQEEIVVREVSVVAEKKRCEEWGGDFRILSNYRDFYLIKCSKEYTDGNKEIKENLFVIEIN